MAIRTAAREANPGTQRGLRGRQRESDEIDEQSADGEGVRLDDALAVSRMSVVRGPGRSGRRVRQGCTPRFGTAP